MAKNIIQALGQTQGCSVGLAMAGCVDGKRALKHTQLFAWKDACSSAPPGIP